MSKYEQLKPAQADTIAEAIGILEAYYMRKGEQLTSPTDTRNYLMLKLSQHESEVFCVLFLDNKHRVIEFSEMFKGTIDSAPVYPREIVKKALELNASAMILAHNHPSGDAEPSPADRAITERISAAANLLDIRLLDHIVVGCGQTFSFAECGLL